MAVRERRVASSDGIQLAVVEAGDPQRPTVILVHGYPSTKEMWEQVMTSLGERFHVVAYDVRGAGASTVPRSRAAYDFDRLADDFAAVVDAVAPGKRVHLVGHDWGGLQGWEFATSPRFQGRLASFTAVAGPSLDQVAISLGSLARHGRLLEAMRRARRSWYILLLVSPRGPELMSRLIGSGGGPPGARSTLPRDVVGGANLYRRNIPRRLLRPRRDAIAHVPVQLIVPTADRYISDGYYELAEQHAPRLRRRSVEGHHWVPVSDPALVAGWIAEHVDEVESDGVSAREVESPDP